MDRVSLSYDALEGHINAGMKPREIAAMYEVDLFSVLRMIAILLIIKTR